MHTLSQRLYRIASFLRSAVPEADFLMTWNRKKYPTDEKAIRELDRPNRDRQKLYKTRLKDLFKNHGFSVIPQDLVGMWKGKLEPSTITTIEVEPDEDDLLKQLAAKAGAKYNQDSVLVFLHEPGPDRQYVFTGLGLNQLADVKGLLKKHDLMGATFEQGREGQLMLIGIAEYGDIPNIESLLNEIPPGIHVKTTKGRVIMVNRADYQSILKKK